jgi:hypothetical protein
MPMNPELRRPLVELGSDAERGNNCEQLKKRISKRLDPRLHEKDQAFLLKVA